VNAFGVVEVMSRAFPKGAVISSPTKT